jgi:hypothetical protein
MIDPARRIALELGGRTVGLFFLLRWWPTRPGGRMAALGDVAGLGRGTAPVHRRPAGAAAAPGGGHRAAPRHRGAARDIGSGLLPVRSSAEPRLALLSSPTVLALRSQAGSPIAWTAASPCSRSSSVWSRAAPRPPTFRSTSSASSPSSAPARSPSPPATCPPSSSSACRPSACSPARRQAARSIWVQRREPALAERADHTRTYSGEQSSRWGWPGRSALAPTSAPRSAAAASPGPRLCGRSAATAGLLAT